MTTTARRDWENRIYDRADDTSTADPSVELPAPVGLCAEAGAGHVRLSWDPVAGAAGYLLERADEPDAQFELIGHGGADVAAVPDCRFADTGVADGARYRYRVGAVAGAEAPVATWSDPASAATSGAQFAQVQVRVAAGRSVGPLHRVWETVGSERLTQLSFGADDSGHDVGAEFTAALRRVHDDLGVRFVRAHAILSDDNHVVHRGPDGSLRFDFSGVDDLYDRLLATGLRPVVELSFMPSAIARDPDETVFTYAGIISPPRDWSEWHAVVRELAAHLVARYGLEEVADWGFEVWNEPNLTVFWSGTQRDYLRLYTEAARAVKSVDARLRVGGPATAAAEWVEALAEHARAERLPLDFVTSHTYGNLPLDVRPALERHGFGSSPVSWTEWGVGSTHFGEIHDSVIGAPFMLSGYLSVQGRMAALAYWVASDHFEELGRPPRLFHDGFGLLSVGNLRKPRYWAAHLAAHQGDAVLESSVHGDGAEVLVQAWATRHDDGTVDILVWNGTVNGALLDGDPRLDRHVTVRIDGLPEGGWRGELARVDAEHSNILRWAPSDTDWPDAAQFARLREHDRLDTEDLGPLPATGGSVQVELELAMPAVARVRLTTAPRSTRLSGEHRADH